MGRGPRDEGGPARGGDGGNAPPQRASAPDVFELSGGRASPPGLTREGGPQTPDAGEPVPPPGAKDEEATPDLPYVEQPGGEAETAPLPYPEPDPEPAPQPVASEPAPLPYPEPEQEPVAGEPHVVEFVAPDPAESSDGVIEFTIDGASGEPASDEVFEIDPADAMAPQDEVVFTISDGDSDDTAVVAFDDEGAG